MAEIEPSSRLYEHDGALYMTVSVLCGVEDGDPSSTPISFVLTDDRLVTVRYATPKPVRAFDDHVAARARAGARRADGARAPARRDHRPPGRRARECRAAKSSSFRRTSSSSEIEERRIPAAAADRAADPIGRAQTLLTKIRYTAVSTIRMLSFLAGIEPLHEDGERGRAQSSRQPDHRRHSLSEHASFLSDNLTFLLDASLGLISIEQNAAMKLFSWAAVVFLPPTLIAGIFGMNFRTCRS